ncbi:cyanophycinase [candidate division KSB1 bacterium]|nr:cyanophycinase [candidate division KSB1 bacterium]
MRSWIRQFFLVLVSILGIHEVYSGPGQRGYLIIIGGGEKPAAAIQKFVQLCENAPILVITSASGVPEESGPAGIELFKSFGAQNVKSLFIASPDSANTDSIVQQILNVRGIFFTGGVQTRLMARLRGTRAEQVINDLYFTKKGVIGGTSAGAAVMSEIMITGDGDWTKLEKGSIKTEKGFGYLKNCIIDQHFVIRQRNNRLLSLAIEKELPGVGIDESTAIIYYPNDQIEVMGVGSVIVYDPRAAQKMENPDSTKLSIANLRVSVLRNGQFFDMKKGKIIK